MSLSEKLKRITNNAMEKGKDLAEKGKGLAEQGKLVLDNQKQQDAIKQAKAIIGGYVADHNLLTEDSCVMEQLAAIAAAGEIIEKNNARIAELKASPEIDEADFCCDAEPEEPCCCDSEPVKRFCPNCGKEVQPESRFCAACGKQL